MKGRRVRMLEVKRESSFSGCISVALSFLSSSYVKRLVRDHRLIDRNLQE